MKKLFLTLLAVALASSIVLATTVAATPPIRLGIAVATLTQEVAERLGIDHQEGLAVLQVMPASPAAEARLVRSDIIIAVDGTTVTTVKDLRDIVKKAGDTVTLTVVGKGDIAVELSAGFPSRGACGAHGARRDHPQHKPKHHRLSLPLGLLSHEMEGIPKGERFSHIMSVELRVTDIDGGPHSLRLIPGAVVSVTGATLTLLINEGGDETFAVTDNVRGHQLLERLEEGQKLIVATVDGEVRALFPPRIQGGHPQHPVPRPLFRFEGGFEN
ncbi:MAG: PDZ domain-containing protein [Dehalococcoidia bacterium]|jgi:hypothetical protein|nr:PDZ domain-containing protein [Dehalococcoidia bacterium]MDP7241031.1 PDZ domain-containing protein [Dehalococcoidia bacterium]